MLLLMINNQLLNVLHMDLFHQYTLINTKIYSINHLDYSIHYIRDVQGTEIFVLCDKVMRDTTFARATLARNVSGEGEGARKCRFYVLRANVVRANVV